MRDSKIEEYIRKTVSEKGFFHFTLVDPEKTDASLSRSIKEIDQSGTDGFLVGGSTGFYPPEVERVVSSIKEVSSKPVVLFPGGVFGVARNADAILFLSLLNSLSTYFLIGAQAQAAGLIKRIGLEAIPVGYIVFGKSSMVSVMGMTQEIEPANYKAATAYALAASLMGMHAIYLEGGSGVLAPIPPSTISRIRSALPRDVLLIVGGGIRKGEDAKAVVYSGADVVVTGTVVEERGASSLKEIVEGCKEGAKLKAARNDEPG
ncbi:MAG: geranylgeranylglyceryl/heptaprenylglyceryl phosphate synthase [Thermoprotei archaeon]|nr:geranylgeranylglyceryl/heptaprenylglyceryl phosphate synthase [TACK group archaeon]